MSHVFKVPDDLYTKLAAYAAQHNQTAETLFLSWARSVAHTLEESTTSSRAELESSEQASEEESLKSPLLQIAGMFAIDELDWADKHDTYLATEALTTDHHFTQAGFMRLL